ncbi:Calreticulin [Trichinella zimbabwensis]|uniref:Calreticulin n=1 Tax=Trichinella zimbabwensis TaxID=268475 RepID=A0A0V1H0J3_9BILA|nr:Calreticulin [Trichinella zimbabwensis]
MQPISCLKFCKTNLFYRQCCFNIRLHGSKECHLPQLWQSELIMCRLQCSFFFILIIFTFQVHSEPTIYLKETFDDGDAWKERWIQSKHKDDYGEWQLSHGKLFADENDMGLKTMQDARFYSLSRKLDKVVDNKDKPLVIVYTVKHEQDIDCGGGYIKLMLENIDLEDFNSDTPYRIMFGPDICGPEKRAVHSILWHDGKNYEKRKNVIAMADIFTHAYKFIIFPNNSYEIWVNNDKEAYGRLEDDWTMTEPLNIDDPDAKKPDDWDEREFIRNPNSTKPDDWDQPETIIDKDAVKPADWDDDMDGEWEPPVISNPDYKGEWAPEQIPNPDYKGKWVPPKIPNPKHVPVPELYRYKGLGAIGFELWQVKSGTIFDNILITDDPEYAKQFIDKQLEALRPIEKVESDKLDQELYRDIAGRLGGGPPKGEETEESTKDDDDANEVESEETPANVKEEL